MVLVQGGALGQLVRDGAITTKVVDPIDESDSGVGGPVARARVTLALA